MEPKKMLAALRAGWWLLLVGLVVGGGAALGVTLLQTPVYSSSTQFFVATPSANTAQALQADQLAQQRAGSYARLLGTQDVAQKVIDRLGLDLTAAQLSREISATASPGTVVIEVTVTDSSAQQAQNIAKALGDEFPGYAATLETRGGNRNQPPVQVNVPDQPSLPSSPLSPNPVRNIVLGLVAGLAVGIALALARAQFGRSVTTEDELTESLGAPLVGHVRRDPKLATEHLAEKGAEDLRSLRRNLQWLNVDNPPRVLMLTGARPAAGATTALVNLALALADAGRRVVVVDADLRTPAVTGYLGLAGEPGLTDVLAGTAELADVVERYEDRDLWVVAAGPKPPNPGQLLASAQMQAIIDKLRGEYDYVLVDAPPLLQGADAAALAGYVDGVLLAVRYGHTRSDQLRQAAAVLGRVEATTLGGVLTVVPPKSAIAARQAAPAASG